jgi:hypothetical protein
MPNQYILDRLAGRDPNLRAADADRERTAERLRKSHAEGRLDLGEFQERLEQCYQAKTMGELSGLVRDLPRLDEQPERRSLAWSRSGLWRVALFVMALIVISAATGHHVFWLLIPLLFVAWRMSWRRRRWPADARRGPGDWI